MHNKCFKSFVSCESVHRCKGFHYLTQLIIYKIHKYRNWETGSPGNQEWWWFVLWYEMILSDTVILQMLFGGCSDSTFKTTDSEKPKIFILLGSIRDPLYVVFFF